jgi:hypothetical protein
MQQLHAMPHKLWWDACRRTALSIACESRQVAMAVALMEGGGARHTCCKIGALHNARDVAASFRSELLLDM